MYKFSTAIQQNLRNLLLRKIPGTKNFEVATDFVFYLYYEKIAENKKIVDGEIIVPKRFVTDFWSIPRFLWWVLNPTQYVGYVIHDYLYSRGAEIRFDDTTRCHIPHKTRATFTSEGHIEEVVITQELADRILEHILKVEGMNRLGRKLVRLGLMIGGKYNFQKKSVF